MRLVVFSHKPCWPSSSSPTGYATDGGFPFQMEYLSQLFDSTSLAVPITDGEGAKGERPITGKRLTVIPLAMPPGTGLRRKLAMLPWMVKNSFGIFKSVLAADAVHAPIPGDIGTIGMLAALAMRKPLFVRHCGNWEVARTRAERVWRWMMERHAGGRNVMLATGGSDRRPSAHNPHLDWIFSTTLTEEEIERLGRMPRADWGARLITVSRQEDGKGTDVLLRALPEILQSFPDATLDVVGSGSALPQLRSLAIQLGITNRVSFRGAVGHDNVLRLLGRSNLFCYPTKSEGFPKVVLEALACGLPVVTTRVSVLPHLIGRGCGKLLNGANPAAVAAAVRECLGDQPAYRRMVGTALAVAREHSLERWRDTIGARLRQQWGPLAGICESTDAASSAGSPELAAVKLSTRPE